jgi:hypothetical protein
MAKRATKRVVKRAAAKQPKVKQWMGPYHSNGDRAVVSDGKDLWVIDLGGTMRRLEEPSETTG